MPAIITHHLFGEDAAARLPEGLVSGEEGLLAFLLGNQGPDPLWARFATLPKQAALCHRLADEMHAGRVAQALFAFREAVNHLPEDDRPVGRAFCLGLVAHYVLDRAEHPFVFAQQDALCQGNPELEGLQGDVHGVIESELDTWMLWSQRGLTVEDAPTPGNLARTKRITRVAGALFSQVAWQGFGIEGGADAYTKSVRDYELAYALVDPAPSARTEAVVRLERLLMGHSKLMSLAHYVTWDDECPAANLDRHPWTDPATGEVRTDTFADLYFDSLDLWPAFAEAFVRGDQAAFEELAGGINYSGQPEKE